jgi:hypothetical protein
MGIWGMPSLGPIATADEFRSAPAILAVTQVMTATQKPSPNATANEPIRTVTKLIWAANQIVPWRYGLPCRSLSGMCSMPCGSTTSTSSV